MTLGYIVLKSNRSFWLPTATEEATRGTCGVVLGLVDPYSALGNLTAALVNTTTTFERFWPPTGPLQAQSTTIPQVRLHSDRARAAVARPTRRTTATDEPGAELSEGEQRCRRDGRRTGQRRSKIALHILGKLNSWSTVPPDAIWPFGGTRSTTSVAIVTVESFTKWISDVFA